MPQRSVGFPEHHMHVRAPAQVLFIVFHGTGRRCSHHKMTGRVLRMPHIGKLHEGGHHAANFHAPRTGQEGDIRRIRDARALEKRLPGLLQGRTLVNGIHQRIARIGKRHALGLKVRDLEREDDEQPVHPGFELADTALAGRPHLGCNVIIDLKPGAVRKFGNLEIEAGIVDENDHVRLPCGNIGLAVLYIPGDGNALEKDFHKAHHGGFPVISHQSIPRLMRLVNAIHEAPAPETDIGSRVLRIQALHEVAAVQVPGSLTGYDVILHNQSVLPGTEPR